MKQSEALEMMKLGHNVFLTGEAGTGKTFVLNKYIEHLKSKHIPIAITASTGIAATHIDGVTLDSWSGLGIRDDISDEEIKSLVHKRHVVRRVTSTKILIIDEISMISGRRFDAYDRILRFLRHEDAPFGGIQVVLSGDLFQLPPVSNTKEKDFIFKSKVWPELALHICYLSDPMRQSDQAFLQVLSDIRHDRVDETTYEILKQTLNQELNTNLITRLYTHNVDVDAINRKELDKIHGEVATYHMTNTGPDAVVRNMKRTCLAPEQLTLKKNALVMFVRNNFEEGFFNGTLGKIIGFNKNGKPVVQISSGQKIIVDIAEWTILENEKIVAQLRQIPLRLAWAITVHKSQGMTLDAAEIDLSKSFVEGMGYVALSRVKSLKNMRLLGLNEMALRVNPEITAIDTELKRISDEISANLHKEGWLKKWMDKRKFMYKLTS